MQNLTQLFAECLIFARYKNFVKNRLKPKISSKQYSKNLENFAQIFDLKFENKVKNFSEFLDDLIVQNGNQIFKHIM